MEILTNNKGQAKICVNSNNLHMVLKKWRQIPRRRHRYKPTKETLQFCFNTNVL